MALRRSFDVLVYAVVLGCASFVACSAPPPPPPPPPETVTLSLATWFSNDAELAELQQLTTQFKVDYSNVLIQLKPVPLSAAPVRNNLLLNGGIDGGWDLAMQTAPFMGAMIPVAENLEGYSALSGQKSTINTVASSTMQFADAGWIGVPFDITRVTGNLHNLPAEAQLGVTTPPSTIQDFISMCDKYVDGGSTLPQPLSCPWGP
jgi:hypothetical protein